MVRMVKERDQLQSGKRDSDLYSQEMTVSIYWGLHVLAFLGHVSDSECLDPLLSQSLQNSKIYVSKLQLLGSFYMQLCSKILCQRVCTVLLL